MDCADGNLTLRIYICYKLGIVLRNIKELCMDMHFVVLRCWRDYDELSITIGKT